MDGFTITAGDADGSEPNDRGGGMYNENSSPTLTNLTFSGNSATSGGGMFNESSSPTLSNVDFSGNSAAGGGGMFNIESNSTLSNVAFYDNSASEGGGMSNESSSLTLTNVTFYGNSATSGGGMLDIKSNSTLTNVTFYGNSAVSGGGMYNWNSNPTLTNVTFYGNSATSGGGMYNESSSPTLSNLTFSDNTATTYGGGMANIESNSTLTNVTFYGNSASGGGGMYNWNCNLTLTSTILWGNTPDQINGSADVTYSDIQGGYSGTGNTDQDPLLGPLRDNGGFTLTHALPYGSPAIDAGNPGTCPATDQRGRPRPVDGDGDGVWRCDMGAFESLPILYVEAGASGSCSSWADACDLQDALAAALRGDEIWVAEGIYYPGPSSARTATFILESGVAHYGGFDPDSGADTFAERDPAAYPSILSGDIDHNDVTAGGVVTDTARIIGSNAYHVVTSAGVTTTTVLDGFTITAGDADGSEPNDRGGGMYNEGSSPTLNNINFSGNNAAYGGGMYNESSSPTLNNVAFSSNTAGDRGGGMYNESNSPTLTNVTFSGNTAIDYGGGMYNYENNSTLSNVTFSGNSAAYGGGMNNNSSSPTLTNAILWGNTASNGAQIFNDGSSSTSVSYSDIQGGYSGTGNIDQDPLLGPLRDNGGFTLTHALPYGSPAIDAGSPATCPASDQRGRPRPVDGDGDGVERCDMGAFEFYLLVYLPLVCR
jgi:hypothetical protein